jgi:hypothetical protein
MRNEDVQLRAPTCTEARRCRDVHAGVADRGRDLRQRPRRVLDVDDEVVGHKEWSAAPAGGASGLSTRASLLSTRRVV